MAGFRNHERLASGVVERMGNVMIRFLPAFILVLFVSAGFLTNASATPEPAETDLVSSVDEDNQQWRQRRDSGLRREHGWLSLVGLEWLKPGANKVGSGAGSDAVLPGGPDYWGTIYLEGDSLRFERNPDSGVLVDGTAPDEIELVADIQGEPTIVQSGSIQFHAIFRESYALRVSDSQAPALLGFEGIPYYPIQPEWRIEGRLIPATEGETIEIGNVLGQVSDTPVFGVLEFDRDGETYRLIGLGDDTSESLWFIFSDRTSGHGTYGAGRFLYSEGLPENGRLVVDFNKAYNPPCAFSDYATCPLPPQENRLNLAITAGEKDFHPPAASK